MYKWAWISLLISASAMATQKRDLPFEPAYAADQEVITAITIEEENNQFQALAQWIDALAEIEERQEDAENLLNLLERARKLVDGNGVSRVELAKREFEYRLNAIRINELTEKAQVSRAKAKLAKFTLIQAGNSSKTDVRMTIAQKTYESLQHQIKSLEYAIEAAELSKRFYADRVEEARRLLEGGHISRNRFEEIEDEFEEAEADKKSAYGQIDILRNSFAGLEKSMERLKKETENQGQVAAE